VGVAVPPKIVDGPPEEVAFKGYISCTGDNGTTTVKVCPQINLPDNKWEDNGNCGTDTGDNGVSLTVYRNTVSGRFCRTDVYSTVPADGPTTTMGFSGQALCS
jgi:hypothetical protein